MSTPEWTVTITPFEVAVVVSDSFDPTRVYARDIHGEVWTGNFADTEPTWQHIVMAAPAPTPEDKPTEGT